MNDGDQMQSTHKNLDLEATSIRDQTQSDQVLDGRASFDLAHAEVEEVALSTGFPLMEVVGIVGAFGGISPLFPHTDLLDAHRMSEGRYQIVLAYRDHSYTQEAVNPRYEVVNIFEEWYRERQVRKIVVVKDRENHLAVADAAFRVIRVA